MKIVQKMLYLPKLTRGFHLITDEIYLRLSEIKEVHAGTLHLFLQHTSASLALGENADESVRVDLERFFSDIADDKSYFTHTLEGKDDMPAHIKSVMIGASVSVPITNGALNLGTWQGIYLCEHRNNVQGRKIVATIIGV